MDVKFTCAHSSAVERPAHNRLVVGSNPTGRILLAIMKKFFKNLSPSLSLFYLFVFSIPFWKRLEIATPWSMIGQNFFEYGTIFLYGTSLLLLLTIVVWAFEVWRGGFLDSARGRQKIIIGPRVIFWLLVLFLLWSAISLIGSRYPAIGFFHFLLLGQVFLIYLFVINKAREINFFEGLAIVIISSGVFQVGIALGQYLKNQSLGLGILGEIKLSSTIAGVAKIIIDGERHIRAYGTFPHPNVLAGFLVIVGIAAIVLFFKTKGWKKYFTFLSLLIVSFGLFITFSRTGWLAATIFWGALGLWNFSLLRHERKRNLIFLGSYFLVLLIFALVLWRGISFRLTLADVGGDAAISERVLTARSAFTMMKAVPLKGVGIGESILSMKLFFPSLSFWQYQPTHNIYLLIGAEMGVVGLLLFLALITAVFYFLGAIRWVPKVDVIRGTDIAFSAILFISFFDHYFWTTQQGILLFGVVFASSIAAGLVFRKEDHGDSNQKGRF